MISPGLRRLLASLLVGLGFSFALIGMGAAQEQQVAVSPKVAEIYDQNEKYVLFSALTPGGQFPDYKLWIRTKATNKVKLVMNSSSFGKNPIVLDAVLKHGEAIAFVALSTGDSKNQNMSLIVQVQLETGQAKRLLHLEPFKMSFGSGGNKLLISSDNKYLFFTADKASAKTGTGPNYPEQDQFRFGVLGTKNPKLEVYRGDLPHHEIDANNGCSVSIPAWETAKKDRRVMFENKAITIFSGKVTQVDFPDGTAFYTKKPSEATFKCYDSNQFGKNPSFRSLTADREGNLLYLVVTLQTMIQENNGEFFIFRLVTKNGRTQQILASPKYKFDEISDLVISPNDRQLAFFATEDGGFGVTPFLLTLGDFADPSQGKPRGTGLKVEPFPFDFKVINGFPCFSVKGAPQTCAR
jgi:hypothetical protein